MIKIGYERLFNIGNFEHEKFIVNKEAESIKEMNDLIREVARLEIEIQRFRKLKGTLTHLESRIKRLGSGNRNKVFLLRPLN